MRRRRVPIAALLVAGLAALAWPPDVSAQGRRRPPPDVAARAHRVFAARVREARSAAKVEEVLSEIEKALPDSARPNPAPLTADVERRYEADPEGTYHAAPPPIRAALDRRLWADATERSLELQVDAAPQDAQELARKARERLPDRPAVADRLLARGLDAAATKDIGSLRQADVEALARDYEKDPKQAGRARDLRRRWLDDQREHRLGASDAEGRVVLAGQYRALLNDSATAATLLQEALRIDPQSAAAASALEALGYRKAGDRWLPPGSPAAEPRPAEPAPTALAQEPVGSLKGLTREELRGKLGKPDRVSRLATQGRVLEQWIYGRQYLNLLRRDGKTEPTVVEQGALP